MAGLYPPDLWPIGLDVCDSYTIRLPTDLSEITYEMQYKLVEAPLIPNFSARDLLFNDDSFVGRVCSSLQIRKFTTR